MPSRPLMGRGVPAQPHTSLCKLWAPTLPSGPTCSGQAGGQLGCPPAHSHGLCVSVHDAPVWPLAPSWAGSGAAQLHQEQKARRGVKHPEGARARVPESCQAVASAHQALLCEGEALELWRRGPRGPPAWAPRPWRADMGGDCRPRLRPGPGGERSRNPMPLMDLGASLWVGNLRLRWKRGLVLNNGSPGTARSSSQVIEAAPPQQAAPHCASRGAGCTGAFPGLTLLQRRSLPRVGGRPGGDRASLRPA